MKKLNMNAWIFMIVTALFIATASLGCQTPYTSDYLPGGGAVDQFDYLSIKPGTCVTDGFDYKCRSAIETRTVIETVIHETVKTEFITVIEKDEVIRDVETIVEKIIYVPVDRIIEVAEGAEIVYIEVPTDRIVEVEKIVEVETIVQVASEPEIVYIEVPTDKIVEIEKEVEIERIVEIEVEIEVPGPVRYINVPVQTIRIITESVIPEEYIKTYSTEELQAELDRRFAEDYVPPTIEVPDYSVDVRDRGSNCYSITFPVEVCGLPLGAAQLSAATGRIPFWENGLNKLTWGGLTSDNRGMCDICFHDGEFTQERLDSIRDLVQRGLDSIVQDRCFATINN